MSDHGFKFGHVSNLQRLEQDWPFISIRLPKFMRKTEFQENLAKNKYKLSTHFDLYKTLKQFFYINKFGGIDPILKNQECRKLFQENDYKTRALRGL